MKCKHLLFIFFCFPAKMFAQVTETDITGLWKGTLYNDTTKQFYQYEIGISEEKGKLSGFSHTWFILDDQQYYGVKKLKIKRQNGKIVIEDAGLISNNYPVAPAKGVRQLNILVLDVTDSIMTLSGPFTTNATKDYRPLTGKIELQRKNDYWQSALVPHLQELNLIHDLSFAKEDPLLARNNVIILENNKQTITIKNTVTEPAKKAQLPTDPIVPPVKATEIVKSNGVALPDNNYNPERLPDNKSDTIYAFTTAAVQLKEQQKNKPSAITNNKNASEVKDAPAVTNTEITKTLPVKNASQNENKISAPSIASSPRDKVITVDPAVKKEESTKNNTTAVPKLKATVPSKISIITSNEPAAEVEKRTTLIQQTVLFRSDSLQISLYDNGEVDGDTVSVLMNGNIIMAKERLSTNAVRKTIFIPSNMDTVQLVMYAENLGTIAPNTGLLVVKDGKDLYEIRFSGDLQKNAAIIFKRKKE